MRSYGFLADTRAVVEREFNTHHLAGLIGGTPLRPAAEKLYDGLVPFIPDQGGTSSCVAMTCSTIIETSARIRGEVIERPSELATYAFARLYDLQNQANAGNAVARRIVEDAREPLFDSGSRPLLAMQALTEVGIVAQSRWPFNEREIGLRPPWDIDQHAAEALLGPYYRIPEGEGVTVGIRAALNAGRLVGFAHDVDQAYEDYDGSSVYQGLQGPVLGRHMETIVGYLADGSFVIAGSWGRAFGRNGFSLMSEAFLESRACDSYLVLTTFPAKVT